MSTIVVTSDRQHRDLMAVLHDYPNTQLGGGFSIGTAAAT